jgi:glucose uptake protein GlcU
MKELFIVGVILALFLVGVGIALKSGDDGQKAENRLRVLAGNFSALLLRVAGYVAGLIAVQRAIGSPSMLDW